MKKLITYFAALASSALGILLISSPAFAEAPAASGGSSLNAIYAVSAALCIAIAAAFGAMSQAKAAATALEGIGRNPGAAGKVQTPMIIALALIESLVIYALVIAFLLQGKIA